MINNSQKNRRYSGVLGLSVSLDDFTKPIFKKRGFVENKILTDWNFIVGRQFGDRSTPKKLVFSRDKRIDGVLHVEVYDSGTAMEMTYMEPVLIEKMASYFGYKAVAKMKIIQRPGGQINIKEQKQVKVRSLSDDKKAILSSHLEDIEDEELKEALGSLGADIMGEV